MRVVGAWVRVWVRAWVRACVRAWVCVCVRACVCGWMDGWMGGWVVCGGCGYVQVASLASCRKGNVCDFTAVKVIYPEGAADGALKDMHWDDVRAPI